MLRFTLKQLEYFRTVAETGSFSAAGAVLHVSPSAVAAAVTELERVLAAQLLIRRKAHGADLTPAGVHVLSEARSLLREASELQVSLSAGIGDLSGPLSVGCYSTLAATALPALLGGFSDRYPNVRLSFVDGTMVDLVPLLERGMLDVLLTYRIRLPVGVEEAVLYETSVHVLLPPSHRLATADSVSLHDLESEDLILLDLPPSGRHTLDMLEAAGVRPTVRHSTQNFELVRSLVARGLGYSLLVQQPRIGFSYEGLPVVAKKIAPEFSKEFVILTWPAGMQLTDRAQAFVDYAVESFSAHRQQHENEVSAGTAIEVRTSTGSTADRA